MYKCDKKKVKYMIENKKSIDYNRKIKITN